MLKKQCLSVITTLLLLAAAALDGAPRAWAQGESKHFLIHVSFPDATLILHAPDSTAIAQFPVVIPRRIPNLPIEGVVESIIHDPWWYPTGPTRAAYFRKNGVELPEEIPPGSPQNAMGKGKITIDFSTPGANTSVRIHGTNHPELLDLPAEERALSRGCIRLRDEDWLALAVLISGKRTHVLFN